MTFKAFLDRLFFRSAAQTYTSEWGDPLDPVAITTDAVASSRLPTLLVVHESGPGGWQFYDNVEDPGEPIVLLKEDLLALDQSLAGVTDLPVAWEAIREDISSPWIRSKIEH